MIYLKRDAEEPLYQGDIFKGIPLAEFSILESLATADNTTIKWEDRLSEGGDPIQVLIELRPVTAMIISQDCDIARDGGSATLALVDQFKHVHRGAKDVTSPKVIQKHITRLARINLQWFYLPRDATIGFTDRMAVDFETTMRLDVMDLMSLRKHRLAGMNEYAREHLRHRIAYFFQRYPVDEWYALDREELEAYRADGHPDAAPYPWQDDDDDA